MLKMAIKCLQCCLWCFEKTVRFVTGYGFVYVAMEGSAFCSACFSTFKLILGNLSQVAVNTYPDPQHLILKPAPNPNPNPNPGLRVHPGRVRRLPRAAPPVGDAPA